MNTYDHTLILFYVIPFNNNSTLQVVNTKIFQTLSMYILHHNGVVYISTLNDTSDMVIVYSITHYNVENRGDESCDNRKLNG